MPSGCDARSRGAVGADHQAGELSATRHERRDLTRGLHVPVVDDLDPRRRLVQDPLHVIERERRRTAVHVPGDVGLHLHHEVRADDAAPGDRGAARVHHHPHPARLRPARHLGGDGGILHARDPDLADQRDAGRGHLPEVGLGQAGLQQDGARVHLDARRTQVRERLVRQDRERLHARGIGRATRRVRLAGRDHRRRPAVQVRIDEVDLELSRREVAEHRMRVVVAEARASRWLRRRRSRRRCRTHPRSPHRRRTRSRRP